MATQKHSDKFKGIKIKERSSEDKRRAEHRLAHLLQKLHAPIPVTVADIKDIFWNMPVDNMSLSKVFSALASYTTHRQTKEALKEALADAWNYFPHRMLGGKSPIDVAKEHPTGTYNPSQYTHMPQRGKTFSDVFANKYPKTVTFEKINDETWGWMFPKRCQDFMDDLEKLEEQGASRDVVEKALYWMLKQIPEFFYAVNVLAQWHAEKGEFDTVRHLYEHAITKARTHIRHTAFVRPRDRIRWTFTGNRDFLDMLYGYAGIIEASGYLNEAIGFYEELLSFNPGDEQRVRGLLATAYLKARKPEEVIGLTAYFQRDRLPEMVMGALLAFIQQADFAIAKKIIKQVKVTQRNVVKELLKATHTPPLTLPPRESVTPGSEEEAYYCWLIQGSLWEQTPGALDLLRRETTGME
jgi:tetratricopeptide (TPR) repeat protein